MRGLRSSLKLPTKLPGLPGLSDPANTGSPSTLPPAPAGHAYATDRSGKYLLWKRTAYSEPTYLLTRIN